MGENTGLVGNDDNGFRVGETGLEDNSTRFTVVETGPLRDNGFREWVETGLWGNTGFKVGERGL